MEPATDNTAWEIPDSLYRCPACGKFVSDEKAFGDVEPGGCRGIGYLEAYCDEACATASYLEKHAGNGILKGGDPCDCEA